MVVSPADKGRNPRLGHFFIKNRGNCTKIIIDHCRTNDVMVDYFAKPLQWRNIKYFRDVVMGFNMAWTNRKKNNNL